MINSLKKAGCLALAAALFTLSACTGAGQGTQPGTQAGTQAGSTNIPSPGTNPSSNPGAPPQFTKPSTGATGTSANGGQTVAYKVLDTLPASIADPVEAMVKKRGYFFFPKEKILLILMGERSTGGYSLSLKDLAVVDGTLGITVVETSPKPGDPVTQALTYPMLALQFEEGYTSIQIQNDKGETYPKLEGTAR